jgi:hypothetical protein
MKRFFIVLSILLSTQIASADTVLCPVTEDQQTVSKTVARHIKNVASVVALANTQTCIIKILTYDNGVQKYKVIDEISLPSTDHNHTVSRTKKIKGLEEVSLKLVSLNGGEVHR